MAKAAKSSKGKKKGAAQTYHIFGADPNTGKELPNRTVTQAEWRKEKLSEQGYVKPADLDDGTKG